MQQQSACFQIMHYLKYLISIEITTTTPLALYGNGTYLCMYAKDGDILYLHHHTVSISKFSAHSELLSGRILASGQSFLLSLIITIPGAALHLMMKTMLLLHSSTLIKYVMSGLT